ncbi:MAG: hypothetical protein ACE365_06045 [Gammaproteobacteria bacterium]
MPERLMLGIALGDLNCLVLAYSVAVHREKVIAMIKKVSWDIERQFTESQPLVFSKDMDSSSIVLYVSPDVADLKQAFDYDGRNLPLLEHLVSFVINKDISAKAVDEFISTTFHYANIFRWLSEFTFKNCLREFIRILGNPSYQRFFYEDCGDKRHFREVLTRLRSNVRLNKSTAQDVFSDAIRKLQSVMDSSQFEGGDERKPEDSVDESVHDLLRGLVWFVNFAELNSETDMCSKFPQHSEFQCREGFNSLEDLLLLSYGDGSLYELEKPLLVIDYHRALENYGVCLSKTAEAKKRAIRNLLIASVVVLGLLGTALGLGVFSLPMLSVAGVLLSVAIKEYRAYQDCKKQEAEALEALNDSKKALPHDLKISLNVLSEEDSEEITKDLSLTESSEGRLSDNGSSFCNANIKASEEVKDSVRDRVVFAT